MSIVVAAGYRCPRLVNSAMAVGDCNALVAGEVTSCTPIECFEGKRVVQGVIGHPCGVSERGRIVEAYLIFHVLDVVGWRSISVREWSEAQDTIDGPGIVSDVCQLAETVLRDVVFGNGERVVEEAKRRNS